MAKKKKIKGKQLRLRNKFIQFIEKKVYIYVVL